MLPLLKKMAEESQLIHEIPVDSIDVAQDIAEETEAEPAEIEVNEPAEIKAEPIKPKAKGRPKGSLNKGPPKPRAKKKTQIQETPVEEDSPPVYEPSSPKRNLKIPTDPSSSDIAAAMLKLLQDQSYSRQSRKQRLYNSWFH